MKKTFTLSLLFLFIFFIACTYADNHQEVLPVYNKPDSKRGHEVSQFRKEEMMNQMSRARGVSGSELIRPKGKKNAAAMALTTSSTSLTLIHLTIAILFHRFLF